MDPGLAGSATALARALVTARSSGLEIVESELMDFPTVIAPADGLKALLLEYRAYGFAMLADIVYLDYLEYTAITPARFALVYNLLDPTSAERVLVKVYLDDGQSVPTVTDVWPGANFMEREAFDMMGFDFDGHPDLRKILTPEDLDGHVLRKDFPLGETPTLFREGRFIDPAAFRAGLTGRDAGLSGWRGGARKTSTEDREPPTARVPSVTSGPRKPGAAVDGGRSS